MIQSVGRGVPISNAHIYLPSPQDLDEIRRSSFDLFEQIDHKSETKSKLFNFEYCLRQCKTFSTADHVQFEEQVVKMLDNFNVRKSMYTVIKQIVLDETLEYNFKLIGENMQIETGECKRLQIG